MTRVSAGLSLLLLGLTWPAAAQPDPAEPQAQIAAPAHLAVIDGAVWLERQGRAEAAPANMPLVAGDRLRTERGRVEVLFGDGSLLHLDQFTTVDFQSDALLRLIAGRLRLIVAGLDPDNPDERVSYRIDTPGGSAQILTVGDYRVSLVGAPAATDVELAVLRGSAELSTDVGSVHVSAGERSLARMGSPPSYPAAFNSARWDAFDRWSEERRDARLGVTSTQYLPAPLAPYASTFDRHGYWRHHATYGYVWYPTVSVGWRPYYYGNWRFFGTFGWTWIGYDPWAWPTHHFGRWGFSVGRWFWMPGIRWGPAWVSWAWAPGYVGWCPLGYNGWPVFGVNTFYTVNYYGRDPYYPWHGWSVVSDDAFASGHVAVARHGVAIERMDQRVRAAFASRTDPPPPTGLAVPRPASPIRAVGTRSGYAVPRFPAAGHATPRSSVGTSLNAVPRVTASPGVVRNRAAATRTPPAVGRLSAPPRVSSPSSSPGAGSLATAARARGAVEARQPTRGLAIPRRAPTDASPDSSPRPPERVQPRRAPATTGTPPSGERLAPRTERDPTGVRERPGLPGGLGPRPRDEAVFAPPAASRRAPEPPRYRGAEGGRPPVMREGPSAPRGGGGAARSAPPRAPGGSSASPRGSSPRSAPSAPRGGASAAVRRRPG